MYATFPRRASQRKGAPKPDKPAESSCATFVSDITRPTIISIPAMAPCNRCGYPRAGHGRGRVRAPKRAAWAHVSKYSLQAFAPVLRAGKQRSVKERSGTKKHMQEEQPPKPASVVLCQPISVADRSDHNCG